MECFLDKIKLERKKLGEIHKVGYLRLRLIVQPDSPSPPSQRQGHPYVQRSTQ